jgi:hypothetical protein
LRDAGGNLTRREPLYMNVCDVCGKAGNLAEPAAQR